MTRNRLVRTALTIAAALLAASCGTAATGDSGRTNAAAEPAVQAAIQKGRLLDRINGSKARRRGGLAHLSDAAVLALRQAYPEIQLGEILAQGQWLADAQGTLRARRAAADRELQRALRLCAGDEARLGAVVQIALDP